MMSSAHRYLPSYTVKDYHGWEGDWELWQGILSAFQLNDSGIYQPQNFSDELVLKVCEGCELRFPAASLFT